MSFKTSTRLLVLIAVVSLLLPAALFAQSNTQGAIAGTVLDSSNAVVANATVTLKSLDKGFTSVATTNGQGGFSFPLVDAGNYSVTVGASGFKQYAARISVQVGQATTVNAKLDVGATGTTVEVSGAAPLVNTENPDGSTGFDQNLVENVPNGGNDLTAVAYTAPGVVMNSGGGYGNFNVNGLPATSNMFTVDGENQMDPFLNLNNSGPTNLMLGKNSIQEATVVTDSVSGQYGQQAGAQVNFVSKGGTNQYHGNVNYQWTGSVFDANDWFNTAQTPQQPRPFANNNNWSASFGGPIQKDKTFFFIDTEGIRYIVPSTQTVYTPTTQFLNDVLANLPVAGVPTGSPYPNASAATIATYATAAKIWEAAPGFNTGTPIPASEGSCTDGFTQTQIDTTGSAAAVGCIQSYQASPALPASEWLLIGRFDHNFGNKDRAFFRFDIDRGTQATYADPIDPAAFSAASFQPAYNNGLTWTHAFSGTATNQFVAAGSYYRAIFVLNTNGPTSPFPYSLYLVGDTPINGLNAENLAFPQGRNVTQYQFVDDFAKTIGRHALKIGANFRRYDITNYDASQFVTPEVVPGLGDFFNGSATEYIQNNPLHPTAPMNTGGIGLYAQDEWSVTSRLKLTLALRGEHNFNPTCDTDCFTLPKAAFPTIQAQGVNAPYINALSIGRHDAFNSIDAVDWSPRVGFVWSPRADSKTVLSGAFSMLYDAFPAFITDSFVNVPYLIGVTQFGPTFGAPNLAWGDPAGAAAVTAATANTIRNGNPGLGIKSLANGLDVTDLLNAGGAQPSITGFPGKLKIPQVQEWNFSVQQALDSKSKLTLTYTGNHGVYEAYPNSTYNASTTANFNPSATDPGFGTYSPNIIAGYPTCTPAPYGVLTTQGGCSATPDPRFGTYTEWHSGAVSNYNGMTASYSRRMTMGLVANASYTWSHSIDEISNGGLLGYGVTSILGQINPLSLRANNYGNSDYDIRNNFNANWVWTTPYHSDSRAMNAVFGGWLFSENFNVRSGIPFTVVDGTTSIQNGGTATPVQVLGPAQQDCRNGNSQCFNSGQFAPATNLGAFPDETRNQYRGPGFFNTDFTFGKDFHVGERVKFNIGANIYNIFNHPNFQNPNRTWTNSTCSSSGTCGQITGQAAPPTGPYGSFFNGLPAGRVGQVQAKITF
jgi:Carboxypeptidase regulatory-like domain